MIIQATSQRASLFLQKEMQRLIIPSEKYQVPHYFFKKKISFFLRNKELLDFFLGKGNAFFNRSIIELIVVAQKKKINNDTT